MMYCGQNAEATAMCYVATNFLHKPKLLVDLDT
jgi:hypothetical protein